MKSRNFHENLKQSTRDKPREKQHCPWCDCFVEERCEQAEWCPYYWSGDG